jgi:GTP cyclohydrolase II
MKLKEPAGTVRGIAATRMPTKWGMFRAVGFEREVLNGSRQIESALALVLGDVTKGVPLVRIHSKCLTGEMLGSLRCDCGDQFEMAMRAIAEEGRGLLIYEHQEGRGIGLMAKLRTYALQDAGLDTVDANLALGFPADGRDFSLPAAILHELGVSHVRRARPCGVLERRGQTEAAVDLAGLAGLYPAGVICEIVNDDGTMARVPDLIQFCRKHGLMMITVAELARYRFELDLETSFAGIDGLLPISPKYPTLAARRFEPADLCLTGKG